MTDEKQRAAAICDSCGVIHVVRIRPDDTVRIIGRGGTCPCGEDDLRILGGGPGIAEESSEPGGSVSGASRATQNT